MMKYAKTISLLTAALLCTSAFTACNPASAQASTPQPQVESAAKQENPLPDILVRVANVDIGKTVIVLLTDAKDDKNEVIYGATALLNTEVKDLLNMNNEVKEPISFPLRHIGKLMEVKKIDKSASAADGVPDIPARLVKVETQEINGIVYFFVSLRADDPTQPNWRASGSRSIRSVALVYEAQRNPDKPISLQRWNVPLLAEKIDKKRGR